MSLWAAWQGGHSGSWQACWSSSAAGQICLPCSAPSAQTVPTASQKTVWGFSPLRNHGGHIQPGEEARHGNQHHWKEKRQERSWGILPGLQTMLTSAASCYMSSSLFPTAHHTSSAPSYRSSALHSLCFQFPSFNSNTVASSRPPALPLSLFPWTWVSLTLINATKALYTLVPRGRKKQLPGLSSWKKKSSCS